MTMWSPSAHCTLRTLRKPILVEARTGPANDLTMTWLSSLTVTISARAEPSGETSTLLMVGRRP